MSAATTAPRTSARTAAGWAAVSYALLFVLAIFANFIALGQVLDPADAPATAAALVEHETSMRLGAAAFLAIFLLDVVIAWALLVLLRAVQADLALLAAWFRLTYTVLLGASMVALFVALELVETAGASDSSVLLALQSFDFLWVVGLSAFGVHLVLVGLLLLRANGAPRLLGWLLVLAGAAYATDTVAHLLLSDYEAYADLMLAVVAVPSVVAELWFTVWLALVATGRWPAPTARGTAHIERVLQPS